MKDLAINKTHLILVNAVVRRGDEVLISKRSQEELHQPGKWTIPGGKVERTKGQVWHVIEKTLAKEVLEETGIKIKNDPFFIVNNTFIRSTGQHVVALIFLCEYKSGKAKPLEDTDDVKWITKKEINNFDFAPNVKKYILEGFKFKTRNG
jgi:ADP-ribose pyrophosphatase YjhB (NUDIX family)